MRVLSDEAVASVIDLSELLDVVAGALSAQRDGAVERPERPHFPVGFDPAGASGDRPGERTGDGNAGDVEDSGDGGPNPAGTALTMPAYVHGADHYATKLVSVHEGTAPTVQAQVVVTEARTGRPAALLAGTRITNARTGCVGGLAARHLANAPVDLGLVGAGRQARWQARAVDAATDLRRVRVYSPSDSRLDCARDLRAELGVEATAVDAPREAVADASVVVTATTATEPVFPGAALAPGAVVVAVGAYTPEMRELDAATVDRARTVYADVPGEAAAVGDLPDHAPEDLRPLADALDAGAVDSAPADSATSENPDRPEDSDATADPGGQTGDRAGDGEAGDVVVVESVGSAVFDAAAAEYVLSAARESGAGVEVDL